MSNDNAIEQEIQSKGLNAPRVTPADLEDAISSEHFFTAAQGDEKATEDAAFAAGKGSLQRDYEARSTTPKALELLTLCVLVLKNGFTVVGKSACASPENFDADLGRKIARADAVNQMWPLLGYALKDRLWNGA
jgi:Phage protein (N4 Gp49/phage Sf6 gene 66) family